MARWRLESSAVGDLSSGLDNPEPALQKVADESVRAAGEVAGSVLAVRVCAPRLRSVRLPTGLDEGPGLISTFHPRQAAGRRRANRQPTDPQRLRCARSVRVVTRTSGL